MPSYDLNDTIYALSSGLGKGGVAVIRVSGKAVRTVIKNLTGLERPQPRYAYFKALKDEAGTLLDQALVLFFEGPHSFTGEDVAEFQVHGGRQVIQSVMAALGACAGCRPAERGEFSRRAVLNGKMDLTSAEGLMDLIDAETAAQQAQALSQLSGKLGALYEGWRHDLVRYMGYLEAFIDFPEEEIPPEKLAEIDTHLRTLIHQIRAHLDDERTGEKLREGFQIALVGAPNVGKSSLMNALTRREVAIVSQTAGTTRDVVEVHLDVVGFPVILADTAGLRETAGDIEAEGIRRAVKRAREADLILHIQDAALYPELSPLPETVRDVPVLTIWNKADLNPHLPSEMLALSAKTGAGIPELWDKIKTILGETFGGRAGGITRERYRVALQECVYALNQALGNDELELKAEDLRLAARALGRITGRIEADELLDVVFREFCIGK